MQKNSVQDSQSFLILLDFSKDSFIALDYLIKFSKSVGGSIELFYISNTIDYGEESNVA